MSIDIGALKDAVKSALDENNVSAGAPVRDLSLNMSKRVLKVHTVNPTEIMPGAHVMPAVCIFTASKSITQKTIAVNQLNAKREGVVTLTIVGLVWNQNFQSNIYDDKASRDLEYLMENIEEILRGNPQISGVTWQFPTDVTYHSADIDEQTHFKVGFLDVSFKFYY